jgi:hypothetical protein
MQEFYCGCRCRSRRLTNRAFCPRRT